MEQWEKKATLLWKGRKKLHAYMGKNEVEEAVWDALNEDPMWIGGDSNRRVSSALARSQALYKDTSKE